MDLIGLIALTLIVIFGAFSGAGAMLLGRFLEWLYGKEEK